MKKHEQNDFYEHLLINAEGEIYPGSAESDGQTYPDSIKAAEDNLIRLLIVCRGYRYLTTLTNCGNSQHFIAVAEEAEELIYFCKSVYEIDVSGCTSLEELRELEEGGKEYYLSNNS